MCPVHASGSVSEQVLKTRKYMTCKPAIVIGINRALIMQIQIQIEHSCLALFSCPQSDCAQAVTWRSTSSYVTFVRLFIIFIRGMNVSTILSAIFEFHIITGYVFLHFQDLYWSTQHCKMPDVELSIHFTQG